MDYYSEVEYPNSQVQCIPCGTTNGIVYGTEQTGTDNSSLCKREGSLTHLNMGVLFYVSVKV
jgi:hypothetical protein